MALLRKLDDEAAAYTFFMICLFLGIVMITYVFMVPFVDNITGRMNEDIADGKISLQTRSAFEWNLNFFYSIAGIALGGIAVFGIQRAIEIARHGDM